MKNIYSTVMGDILLEGEFNYLNIYGVLHVLIA